MAQVKISNLTTYTGTPADIRWFVMNNEGETDTYKYSGYTSGLIPGSGADSIQSSDGLTTNAANASGTRSIAIGDNARATNTESISIGDSEVNGINNVGIGSVGFMNGNYQFAMGVNNGVGNGTRIINLSYDQNAFLNGSYSIGLGQVYNQGGQDHIQMGRNTGNQGGNDNIQIGRGIQASGNTSNIIGIGESINLTAAGSIVLGHDMTVISPESVYIGGVSNTTNFSSTSFHNTLINGSGNTLSNNSSGNVMIGSFDGSINDDNYTTIIGGKQNTSQNNNNDGMNTIIGGYRSGFNGIGRNNIILGGENNDGSGGSNWTGMLAGQNNIIAGGNLGVILGGETNQYNSGYGGFVLGGRGNILNTNQQFAGMIGSLTSTNQKDWSLMVGTQNRAALYDETTHVENIHTFKTETFDVISGGNVGGSITVDCSQGTVYTFTLTADTTPDFTQVKTGQRFIFIIYNNGSWAVPTATVNGVPGTVFAKNGNITPSNNGYSKYTATFDGTNMFLDEELNFSAV